MQEYDPYPMPDWSGTEGYHSQARDCLAGLKKVGHSAGAFYIIVRSRGCGVGTEGWDIGRLGTCIGCVFH